MEIARPRFTQSRCPYWRLLEEFMVWNKQHRRKLAFPRKAEFAEVVKLYLPMILNVPLPVI